MDNNERLARALLGSLVALSDGIRCLDFTEENILPILDVLIDKAVELMAIQPTPSQFMRLKEEAFLLCGGQFDNES